MYTTVELFAGAGGLALGLEKAGLIPLMLNEFDKHACTTLKTNRPHWDVVQKDVSQINFSGYGGADLVAGGFPCQSFSHAGKRLGFEDTRGTLFFEFARAVKEIKPKIFVAENVKGLTTHDGGNTLKIMTDILSDLGYAVLPPKILKAVEHNVPQKRERIFIVGIRKDIPPGYFNWPEKSDYQPVLRDALKEGILYASDVPASGGIKYSVAKSEVLALVPPGGYWRDLPVDIQRSYMGASFLQSGGKTGIARRISWAEPCLTLTCSPAQKQTERCHPEETRPFTVREYARIQTFPDDWAFSGPVSAQYKQIGNAVPVNLAYAIGISIKSFLDTIKD